MAISLPRKVTKTLQTVAIFMVAVFIYALGWGVGSGRIARHKLSTQNGSLPKTLDYSSVNDVYNLIKNDYYSNLNATQLIEGLKNGLAQATGDPYTEYFNPAQAKQFNNQLNESFSGIGAEIGLDANNNLIIASPISGFPAANAGLRAKDAITTIDGNSTTNMSISDAVTRIKGPKGTKVTLGIVRDSKQQLTFTITRDNITVPSVKSDILAGNIGYMQISQFTSDTANLSQKAAQKFKDAGVKGVILDLRNNPGGMLDAAVSVSSLWLQPNNTVLSEKRGDTVLQTFIANGNNLLSGLPTVVLINSGSASASEITALALKDNNVAHLIGEKSYGKGVVQELDNLADGSVIKITVAYWNPPKSPNVNKVGINPDQVVTMSDSDYKNNIDPQKDAAVTWLNQHR